VSKSALITALYNRVSVMTIANSFNFDWSTLKSSGNGARISRDTVLNIEIDKSRPLDSGVVQNGQYKVELTIFVYGYGFKGKSKLREQDYDVELFRAKLEEDIMSAFAFTNLSGVADFMEWVDGDKVDKKELPDSYQVGTKQEYTINYWTDQVYQA